MHEIKIALSLGGNIGNIQSTFDNAIAELAENGICEIRKSSLYFSDAENCVPDTPPFTNMAVTGVWNKSPLDLLELCQKIEENAGRASDHKPGISRTLDIDIILFGTQIYQDSRLQIPHKRAFSRFFVIIPLSEIASDWTFPQKGITVKQVFDNLKQETTKRNIEK